MEKSVNAKFSELLEIAEYLPSTCIFLHILFIAVISALEFFEFYKSNSETYLGKFAKELKQKEY
jgi:hypothetical protein